MVRINIKYADFKQSQGVLGTKILIYFFLQRNIFIYLVSCLVFIIETGFKLLEIKNITIHIKIL